jgi:hypothetical protein
MEYRTTGPIYRPCELFELDGRHPVLKTYVNSPERLMVSGGDHCHICRWMLLLLHASETQQNLDALDVSQEGPLW